MTFSPVPPTELQHHDPGQPPLWLFMHNDWLQIGFEMGVVGLVLCLALFVQTLARAPKRLRPIVAGCGAFMLTLSPLHFFWSAFF